MAIQEDDHLVYLLEVDAFDPTIQATRVGLPPPLGASPTFEWDKYVNTGATETVRISDRGFVTGPGDNPAHTLYTRRLESVLNVSLRFATGPLPFGGGSGSRGEIRVLDWRPYDSTLIDLTWANRPFTVKAGLPDSALAGFTTVMAGRISDIAWRDGVLILGVADPKARLDVPLNIPTYDGLGNEGGGADLTGLTKPACWGLKRQVPGTTVSQALQIYQFHFQRVRSFDAVRVRGDAITASGIDHATYADLAAATISSGFYDTCLALGMVRLGSTADGIPTADLQGDMTEVTGSPTFEFISTTGSIVRRIVTKHLPTEVRLKDPDELDTDTFDDLETDEPGTAGLFIATNAEPPTATEVVDQLMTGIGGWWDFKSSGKMFVGLVKLPTNPSRTITRAEILDGPGVEIQRAVLPPKQIRVGYREMAETLRKEDLAAGLDGSLAELFTQRFRFPSDSISSRAKARHQDAQEVTLESPLDQVTAAARVQNRVLPFLELRPRRFRVPLTTGRFLYELGNVVALQDERIGLNAATNMWVAGLDRDVMTGRLALELLGSQESTSVPLASPDDVTSPTTFIPAGSPTPTQTAEFFSDSADSRILCQDADYSIARSGAGTCSPSPEIQLYVGQIFNLSTYFVHQSVMFFDTSSLGSSANISSATISLAGDSEQQDGTMTIEARIIPSSNPVVAGDFTPGGELSDFPLVATFDASGVVIGSYNQFSDIDLAAHINATGNTFIALSSDRQRLNQAPTGFNVVLFRSADAPSLRPKLTVTYT